MARGVWQFSNNLKSDSTSPKPELEKSGFDQDIYACGLGELLKENVAPLALKIRFVDAVDLLGEKTGAANKAIYNTLKTSAQAIRRYRNDLTHEGIVAFKLDKTYKNERLMAVVELVENKSGKTFEEVIKLLERKAESLKPDQRLKFICKMNQPIGQRIVKIDAVEIVANEANCSVADVIGYLNNLPEVSLRSVRTAFYTARTDLLDDGFVSILEEKNLQKKAERRKAALALIRKITEEPLEDTVKNIIQSIPVQRADRSKHRPN